MVTQIVKVTRIDTFGWPRYLEFDAHIVRKIDDNPLGREMYGCVTYDPFEMDTITRAFAEETPVKLSVNPSDEYWHVKGCELAD